MGAPDDVETVSADSVAHGDVILDPESGAWLTVTRIVNGVVRVDDGRAREAHAEEPLWSFYGDERLDESVTLLGEGRTVTRRRRT